MARWHYMAWHSRNALPSLGNVRGGHGMVAPHFQTPMGCRNLLGAHPSSSFWAVSGDGKRLSHVLQCAQGRSSPIQHGEGTELPFTLMLGPGTPCSLHPSSRSAPLQRLWRIPSPIPSLGSSCLQPIFSHAQAGNRL